MIKLITKSIKRKWNHENKLYTRYTAHYQVRPVMIYKFVDSACPLFLVSRYLSARKMFACYMKVTTCTFQNKPCEMYNILLTSKTDFWKIFK